MTWCLASVASRIRGIPPDKHQQMSFPLRDVLYISPKDEIPAVVHRDISLEWNWQHRADVVQIAEWLATRAMGSYVQQDSSCVERARWLLPMPFWLEADYIFLRTSHFFLLSSSSGLPTLFHYHHLCTSTAANHGSTRTAARWEWNRIEQNDGRFIIYTTCWDATTPQTPLSSPRRCKCSHRKCDPGRTVDNCLYNRKQQE